MLIVGQGVGEYVVLSSYWGNPKDVLIVTAPIVKTQRLKPRPQTLNPINPKPETLNPKPLSTLSPKLPKYPKP